MKKSNRTMPEAAKRSKDAYKHELSSFCKAVRSKINLYSLKKKTQNQ